MLESWREYDPLKLKQEQARLIKELKGKTGRDSKEVQLKFRKLYNVLICRAYGAMDFLDNKANEEQIKKFSPIYTEILDLITETDSQLTDKRKGYASYGFQEASIRRECTI